MTEGAAVRVWDLPTRLFHWSLVALFAFSWWSAENREMEWHVLSGIVLVAMLVFRLIWGFVGGSTARFAVFVRSPRKVLAYLRGRHVAAAGHNPLGGYSALALLALLVLQVVSGLFATDVDGLDSGPLSSYDEFQVNEKSSRHFSVLSAWRGYPAEPFSRVPAGRASPVPPHIRSPLGAAAP